ncbi:MAG TPA: ATP-dependent 6-phosphofructokinase [Candidatus Competibacteraceae bacterium]|nr:ATP-dependent 6-phosphofructokinase [Candidatus Competibacteraceae bacterium]HRZ06154.1 ATP-dependent 6-phosphofructokinase [Candidatus Competibacteraceae bacterium]
MNITTLGEARFVSPQRHTVSDQARVPAHLIQTPDAPPAESLQFELAGPRDRLFFDPQRTRAGIVTCGGLCPGLNNVIRSVFLELYHGYGVQDVLGFRGGYEGLDPVRGLEPVVLSPAFVHDIHKDGGTVLGTSRGPVDIGLAVDNLIRRGVNILFTLGGDGTQRGGNALFQEAQRRGHPLAVVGIPKTIDNDVAFVSRTFGYLTAVEEAAKVLHCAHTEAHSVHNGIALVKLMGRHAGFIAAGATVASQDVNFTFIPEIPLPLDGENGFLAALKQRMLQRAHAVVVVAEGAGQELLAASGEERDASGNIKLQDIGPFLRARIESYFKEEGIPVTLRYFDPSYLIRSVPADAEDSILCDFFARNAVHAAMAGKTGLVIGLLHDLFIHVPIELLVSQKKRLDLDGPGWRAVLAATGQTFDAKTGP